MSAAEAFTSRFYSAQDGLRLHLRDYGSRISPALPVVCLPGLARTAADFDMLARALSAQGRRVVALDYRGRGLSERDKNPANYDVIVENRDIQDILVAAGVAEAVFVGTSRGGIHTMVLSALRPGLLKAVVLNDIGPVLEARGLARIKGYVGKMPQPASWSDAVDLFKKMASAHFTAMSDADWEAFARLTFEEKDGKLAPQYDPALSKNLEKLDLSQPIPEMWPQFEGLGRIPLMIIRGGNSDLLSAETVAEMVRRHPGCETMVVPDQGHAPLLMDEISIGAIKGFVERVEAGSIASPLPAPSRGEG